VKRKKDKDQAQENGEAKKNWSTPKFKKWLPAKDDALIVR